MSPVCRAATLAHLRARSQAGASAPAARAARPSSVSPGLKVGAAKLGALARRLQLQPAEEKWKKAGGLPLAAVWSTPAANRWPRAPICTCARSPHYRHAPACR